MMLSTLIDEIRVNYEAGVTMEELQSIVKDEKEIWRAQGKEIAVITVTIDGEELVIKSVEKSPIIRVRRITGYCSNINNFNDAKRAEYRDRVKHL